MINYLKGILVSKILNSPSGCNITVEVNNIGYLFLSNKRVLDSLPDVGEEVTIYAALVHREDTMYYCGFATREDRDLFNILQSVSGIGTKVALLILGLGAHQLVNAVISSDVKELTKTKGVGPKLAQRIILELKDKMTNWRDKAEYPETIPVGFNKIENRQSYLETESVLLSLGYSKAEAEESLAKALSLSSDTSDSEELLRYSLTWLSEQ